MKDSRDWDERLAAAVLIGAARLVPRGERQAWLEEWRAEVAARRTQLAQAGRLDGSARLDLVRRALGAWRDAGRLGVRGWRMRGVRTDLSAAARAIVRRPGFSVVAVLTLAVGIGATTTLFSVVDAVLIRPLAYPDADRLVAVEGVQLDRADAGWTSVSYPNMADLEARAGSLEAVTAAARWGPALTGRDRAEALLGLTVSWDHFRVTGTEPAHGRFFQATDEGEGREPVVVLSWGLWERSFGADPGVVGSGIQLDGTTYTVLGIAPRSYEDPRGLVEQRPTDVWRTPWFEAADWFRSGRSWVAFARLAPGVELASAEAEARAVMAGLAEEFPDENRNRSVTLTPLKEAVVGDVRQALFVMLAAVGLVLLIACANVANLLLARGLERRRETTVRAALGASRTRLVSGFLLESTMLGGLGGALGLAVAAVGVQGVVGLAGSSLPRLAGAQLSGGVLAFAVLTSLATVLLFGVVPAVRGTETAPVSGERAGTGRHGRLRRGLVLVEVALTVVLLFGSGLLLRTFDALLRVDLGVRTESLLTASLHGSAWYGLEPEAAAAKWDAVLASVRSVPGVALAGAIDIVPLGDNQSCDGTRRADLPPPPPGEGLCTEVRSVTPGAVEALGIGLLAGRAPDERDRADAARVAFVDRTASELLWNDGEEVLGTALVIHGETFTVAGIVESVRHFGPGEPSQPQVYLPAPQEPWNGIARGLSLVVASAGTQPIAEAALRTAVHDVDPGIAVTELRTGDALVSGRVSGPRFRTVLLTLFAVTALLLAVVGLAGVMAFSVRRRTREIGLRVALGAGGSEVAAMVLREGLTVTLGGLVVGTAAALVMSRWISGMLFGVAPTDPVTLGGVWVVLLAVAALACWLPARWAARVDPVRSLAVE